MSINNIDKVCIIGGGLVGSLLSIILSERGFEVDVFEKRPDPRTDSTHRGRSIVMSISERGWNALENVGLKSEIIPSTVPKHSRMVHQEDGTLLVQPYGDGDQSINTINRQNLNISLIQKAEFTGNVKFHFEHSLTDIDLDANSISVKHKGTTKEITYKKIIGADGIFSKVRKILSDNNLTEFATTTLEFGYKELNIPPDKDGDWAIPKNYVHVWPRKNCVFLALPNTDKSFTCTIFMALKGELSFESVHDDNVLLDVFKTKFKSAIGLLPQLNEEFFTNPTSLITTVTGGPWNYKNNITLIGDACHALAPFYAMGMNVGFEDCTVFRNLLDKYENNLDEVIANFESERRPDTEAISDLSYKNFHNIEKSVDPHFHTKWNLDRRIWEILPEVWTPNYARIAFTHIPFREVKTKKEIQDKIINELFEKGFTAATIKKEIVQNLMAQEVVK